MKLRLFFIALIVIGTIIEITMEHRRHVRAEAELEAIKKQSPFYGNGETLTALELSTGTLTAHPRAIRQHNKGAHK